MGLGGSACIRDCHHLAPGPERALGAAEPMWSKPLLLDRRPVGAWLCGLSPHPAPLLTLCLLPGVPSLPSLSPSHRLPARPRPAFASRKPSGAFYHPLPPQLQEPKAGQVRSPAGAWTARRPGQGAGQQASRVEARLSSLSPEDTTEERPWTPNPRASWGTSTTLPGQRPWAVPAALKWEPHTCPQAVGERLPAAKPGELAAARARLWGRGAPTAARAGLLLKPSVQIRLVVSPSPLYRGAQRGTS